MWIVVFYQPPCKSAFLPHLTWILSSRSLSCWLCSTQPRKALIVFVDALSYRSFIWASSRRSRITRFRRFLSSIWYIIPLQKEWFIAARQVSNDLGHEGYRFYERGAVDVDQGAPYTFLYLPNESGNILLLVHLHLVKLLLQTVCWFMGAFDQVAALVWSICHSRFWSSKDYVGSLYLLHRKVCSCTGCLSSPNRSTHCLCPLVLGLSPLLSQLFLFPRILLSSGIPTNW